MSIFFPWVGFINGIDNQPTFILAATFFSVFYLRNQVKFEYIKDLLTSTLILIFACIIKPEWVSLKFFVTYLFIIFNIFFIRVYFLNKKIKINYSFVLRIYIVYFTIGFIQLFIPDFMSFFVSRSSDDIELLIESGRGGSFINS